MRRRLLRRSGFVVLAVGCVVAGPDGAVRDLRPGFGADAELERVCRGSG